MSEPNPNIQIRWLIRRDMSEVLAIESECFAASWTADDFLYVLSHRNCIGMVAEREHRIAAFMVYELHQGKLDILNFAVKPACRRQKIATAMVFRLIDKLSEQRRKSIELMVRETNIEAQQFFRSQGFKAVRIVSGKYDDTEEDGYVMQYRLDQVFEPWRPSNRIACYTHDDD